MGVRLKSWYSNRQKVYFRYTKNSMTSLNYHGRNDIFNAFLNERERGEGGKKKNCVCFIQTAILIVKFHK